MTTKKTRARRPRAKRASAKRATAKPANEILINAGDLESRVAASMIGGPMAQTLVGAPNPYLHSAS